MRDLTGRTLGQYQVLELVGEGGMARVYKVWDKVRSTNLALKLLHEDLAEDKVFIRRFQREAQTLERLQHPNIVRFYGLEREGIQAFMIVDFIDGFTLRTEIARMEGHPMSAGRVMEIMRPVCSALQYAHSQGIAHCDIKPANIMLSRNGTVLVSDFGIARVTEGAATMTMAGAGTPAYMAPEQIMGATPSPQTDIYGLGVVLFEMLTGGERPFTGDKAKVTGTSGEKVRWEHVNLTPMSPREFNKEIPLDLEAVVMKCLDKDPSRRYTSPMELLASLDKALANYKIRTYPGTRLTVAEDVTLPPPPGGVTASRPLTPSSPAPKAVEPSRRSGWVWGIGILIGLLCIGGLAAVLLLNVFPITIANGGSINPANAQATQTPLPTYTPLPTFTPLPSSIPPTLPPPATNTLSVPVLPNARPLTAGVTVNGNTKSAGELWYFEGQQGQAISIVVIGEPKYQTFSLRDSKNNGIAGCDLKNQSTCSINHFTLPYSGVFYVFVDRTWVDNYKNLQSCVTNPPYADWCYRGGPYSLSLVFE